MRGVECVAPLAAAAFDPYQPRRHEPLEMASGGRPRVAEAIGQLTRGHRSPASVKRHEDVPSMLIRKRGEHGLELVELSQATRPWAQRISFVEKCGNAIPGPIARFSTSVSIRSQITPTCGCCAARRDPSASSHWKMDTISGPVPS